MGRFEGRLLLLLYGGLYLKLLLEQLLDLNMRVIHLYLRLSVAEGLVPEVDRDPAQHGEPVVHRLYEDLLENLLLQLRHLDFVVAHRFEADRLEVRDRHLLYLIELNDGLSQVWNPY